MKTAFLLSCLLFGTHSFAKQNLKTVKDLDLNRYQGTWNQLAAIPASFQRDCVGNTTAQYTKLKSGLINVVNTCDRKDGSRRGGEARARINPSFKQNSKLEVTFVKIFDWVWTFAGDYWVTYIDKNYQNVIVGSPKYDYGWILSRKKTLKKSQYRRLAGVLKSRGYDPCEFIMSKTKKQFFKKKTRLCDL